LLGGIGYKPYHTPFQKSAAKSMGKIASKLSAKFCIALGDNFYSEGVDSVDSNRFEKTWKDVYDDDSLAIPWLLIAGNHDHKQNVSAQIEYSSRDSNWVFPNFYHSHSYSSSDNSVKVDVILLDTIDLCGANAAVTEDEPGYFDPLPHRVKGDNAQWAWLEDALSKSTANYILVGGHYPIYSVCEHGPDATLINELLPLLKQYNAHYMSGHDHCQNHFVEPNTQVNIMLTGVGDTCCYKNDNINNPAIPAGALKWYVSAESRDHHFAGFMSMTATASELIVTYFNEDGEVQYQPSPVAPRV